MWSRTVPYNEDVGLSKADRPAREAGLNGANSASGDADTSDEALFALLDRIKTTDDPGKLRTLADQLERLMSQQNG